VVVSQLRILHPLAAGLLETASIEEGAKCMTRRPRIISTEQADAELESQSGLRVTAEGEGGSPMCEHKNTGVRSSRTPDSVTVYGKPWYAAVDYPCLMFRRRKCLDCGESFTTVEVPKEYMDASTPKAIRLALAREVATFLVGDEYEPIAEDKVEQKRK
jgi:hypothetical protein